MADKTHFQPQLLTDSRLWITYGQLDARSASTFDRFKAANNSNSCSNAANSWKAYTASPLRPHNFKTHTPLASLVRIYIFWIYIQDIYPNGGYMAWIYIHFLGWIYDLDIYPKIWKLIISYPYPKIPLISLSGDGMFLVFITLMSEVCALRAQNRLIMEKMIWMKILLC